MLRNGNAINRIHNARFILESLYLKYQQNYNKCPNNFNPKFLISAQFVSNIENVRETNYNLLIPLDPVLV